jgi:Glyoxalase-like domain
VPGVGGQQFPEHVPADPEHPGAIDASAERLVGLGATMTGVLQEEGIDHYGVAMRDPEGNEFDIN